MPTPPRILLTTLPALALGACFDPLLDQDSTDGADTASEGSTTDLDFLSCDAQAGVAELAL